MPKSQYWFEMKTNLRGSKMLFRITATVNVIVDAPNESAAENLANAAFQSLTENPFDSYEIIETNEFIG
jgi:hypothetical protein